MIHSCSIDMEPADIPSKRNSVPPVSARWADGCVPMAAVFRWFNAAEHRTHRMLRLRPADRNADEVELAAILIPGASTGGPRPVEG